LHNDQIKIGDLGSAKSLNESLAKTYIGTPVYMSPEMVKYKSDNTINVTLKADVWSIGIVIYELFKLKLPFQKVNEIENNAKIPDLDSDVSEFFKILMNMYYVFISTSFWPFK
jgi:serine/threonine protein kinase